MWLPLVWGPPAHGRKASLFKPQSVHTIHGTKILSLCLYHDLLVAVDKGLAVVGISMRVSEFYPGAERCVSAPQICEFLAGIVIRSTGFFSVRHGIGLHGLEHDPTQPALSVRHLFGMRHPEWNLG